MREKKEKSKRSAKPAITGIIVPAKWNNNGNVVGVSIHAFDEKEYIVKTYKLGKALLQFVNQTVSVTGKVSERLDGRLIIEVSHFDVINRFDDIQDAAASKE
jgi:Tol biopolymer transport system component